MADPDGGTGPDAGHDEHRPAHDELGEVQVPVDAYWGAHTQRALENFPISDHTFGRRYVRALGVVKKASAQANHDLGYLTAETVDAVVAAADEVIAGEHDDQFPVDVFQTGSGTSSNMNANEVIANRATELLGDAVGDHTVHPNDHVNFGQSSNDVTPTAMSVAALEAVKHDLLPALEALRAELEAKEATFDDVVKPGRTHLQDAIPIRLGQEFGGYRRQVEKGIAAVERSRDGLRELALGGNQVGTGLNCPEGFPELAAEYITAEIGIDVHEAPNHVEAQASHVSVDEAHGALRTVANSVTKIANDLRLLASGPRAGFGEIDQPTNQPGSSITPGKINPVVAEAVNQVHARVAGNDTTVSVAAAGGELEINLYKPVLAYTYLESATILANASEVFARRFVAELEVDRETCAKNVERGIALATALNPHVGYDKTADVAQTAIRDGKTVREVVVEKGYLTADEADRILDARRMTEGGILDRESGR